jgi:hypothetical protein
VLGVVLVLLLGVPWGVAVGYRVRQAEQPSPEHPEESDAGAAGAAGADRASG